MRHTFLQSESWKDQRFVWETPPAEVPTAIAGKADQPTMPKIDAAVRTAEIKKADAAGETAKAEEIKKADQKLKAELGVSSETPLIATPDPSTAAGKAATPEIASTAPKAPDALETGAVAGGMAGFIKTLEQFMEKITKWFEKFMGDITGTKKSPETAEKGFKASPADNGRKITVTPYASATGVVIDVGQQGAVHAVGDGKITKNDPVNKTVEVTLDDGRVVTYTDFLVDATLPSQDKLPAVIVAGAVLGKADMGGKITMKLTNAAKNDIDPTPLLKDYIKETPTT